MRSGLGHQARHHPAHEVADGVLGPELGHHVVVHADQVGQVPVGQRLRQRGLVGEPPVEGAHRHLGPGRDEVGGGRVVAHLLEDRFGHVEQVFHPGRGAGLAGRVAQVGGSDDLLTLPAGRLAAMERPPADPAKLLASWMEWERGEITPGRVMADLKTGGLRDVLEHLAETAAAESAAAEA